jgi:tetratricopeptide (TPR) repeat protein
MNPKRKTAQIDRLADAIGYIATDFERFGGLFLDALLEVPMNHQGTNIVGYAVGGVVDTVSDDGRIAAEYSDAGDYFDGSMSKAESDLTNALQRLPSARNIFLLSGQRRRPQNAASFETRVRAWPDMAGKTLHLWGAEEIASRLVEELVFSDTVVRRLARYLPELQRIRDEEAVSRLAPAPDRTRLVRPEVEAELARRLAAGPVVTISGIGGLGKSAAAAAYAADKEADFDLVIWLDTGEVRRIEQFQALTLVRAGETRNVTALLRTRACLLVVDNADPGLSAQDLSALCGPRSRIILTQRAVTPGSYELPLLTEGEAAGLLPQEGALCPPEVFGVIWSTVGGHPLSLALIAAAVTQQGATWAEIALDCQAVGELDDRGERLADRLLGRLRTTLERELSVFAWARQAVCGQEFLAHVVQPLGIRKLRGHGLTAAHRSGVVRLHDVVFAVLSADWCSVARSRELEAALERYLIAAATEAGPQLWTTGRILRPKLEQIVADGARQPAFRYALLSVWDPAELRPELVGDPIADADELAGRSPGPLAVMGIIEAIELLFLSDKLEGDEVAKARLHERLPVFDKLAALPGLSDRQMAEIEHHRGKALKRLGDASAAATQFERVLAGPVPMHETRLQLIDIYRTDPAKVERTTQLVDEILDEQDVSYSVLLGVIERLPWGSGEWRAGLIQRHASAIEGTIVEAADVGVQQAFSAFAALGRYLSTEEPEMFQRILGRLPKPTPESLQTDSDRFAWAEIYSEAARAPGADAPALRAQALALYESEVSPQRFHLQRRAELLIDMARAVEAEALLRQRDDLESSEWLQRLMARARLAQGDAADALAWLEKALARLKAERFRSEFLELRFDIRTALGDAGAPEDLRSARAASQKVAEGARLDARLAQLVPPSHAADQVAQVSGANRGMT